MEIGIYCNLDNMPMGNELKWLLKEGGGCIFESCDISLENMPTSHAVSLAFDICACSHVLAYAVTAMVHVCFRASSCLT